MLQQRGVSKLRKKARVTDRFRKEDPHCSLYPKETERPKCTACHINI